MMWLKSNVILLNMQGDANLVNREYTEGYTQLAKQEEKSESVQKLES